MPLLSLGTLKIQNHTITIYITLFYLNFGYLDTAFNTGMTDVPIQKWKIHHCGRGIPPNKVPPSHHLAQFTN
jgi:hypothetical protein